MKNKKIDWFVVKLIALAVALLVFIAVMACKSETVPQTQSVLHSYFTTGNRPTQTNYWEFIDTMFWYANQTYSNSVYAAQQASKVGMEYQAYANLNVVYGTNLTAILNAGNNIGTMIFTTPGTTVGVSVPTVGVPTFNLYTLSVTFSNALAGSNYVVSVSAPGGGPFTAANYTSSFEVHGATNAPAPGYVASSGFAVNFISQSPANLNGANVIITAF